MNSSNASEDAVCYRLKKNEFDILKRVFRHVERDISKSSDIDANFSGTTCVMVFQVGERLICANVGDSRAILVKGNNIIPLEESASKAKKYIEIKDRLSNIEVASER